MSRVTAWQDLSKLIEDKDRIQKGQYSGYYDNVKGAEVPYPLDPRGCLIVRLGHFVSSTVVVVFGSKPERKGKSVVLTELIRLAAWARERKLFKTGTCLERRMCSVDGKYYSISELLCGSYLHK